MKHLLTDIPGIGESTAALLAEHGIDSVKALLKGGEKKLCKVPGFGEVRAAAVLAAAEGLKEGDKAAGKAAAAEAKAAKKAEKEAKKAAKAEARAAKKAEKETKKAARKGAKKAKKSKKSKGKKK